MEHAATNPVLRLVGGRVPAGAATARVQTAQVPAGHAPSDAIEHPTLAVARENQRSATLSRDDARRLFAIRVAHSLEGGRQAILTPDRRRALVAEATAAGLREFDAGLVIAIVQDAARTGSRPAAEEVQSRLSLVRPAPVNLADADRERDLHIRSRLVLAACLAGLLLLALINWFLR